MKYILLIICLLPAYVLAETNDPPAEPVEEVDETPELTELETKAPSKVKQLSHEEERDMLLGKIEALEKKIAKIEKDNANLKNQMLRQRQRAGVILKLAVDANTACSKVLEALGNM